jgi:SAM-dependent methyltransferase
LTLFYLVVSAGGVIGGAFVGFLAPVIFPAIWEYPILLVAALAGAPGVGTSVEDFAGRAAAGLAGSAGLGASAGSARFAGSAQSTGRAGSVGVAVPGRRPGLDLQPFFHGARRRLAPFLVIGAACAVAVGLWQPLGLLVMVPFMGLGALILALGSTPRLLSTATGVVLAATLLVQPAAPIYSERDFFGVVAVKRSGDITTMWHGTTPHGNQASDPAGSRSPRGYYDRHGPLGDAMALAQARGGQNIGVIGLGAGVIAAYERPTDNMTFFEIDPAVVRAAEDPSLFTYLAQAPNRPTVVIGDGRLELRTIPNATYDVLILDAFSGDSIPTHLITVEALRDDLRVLKPNGLLMVHVSNRYYDLAPAVAAGARDLGMTSLVRRYNPTKAEQENGAQSSEWVVAAVDAGQLAQLTQLASAGWERIRPADQAVTDDYPDVLRFARFGGWFGSP